MKGGVIRDHCGFASADRIGDSRFMQPSRPLLHALRIADAIFFYPVLLLVIWGELSGPQPIIFDLFQYFSDKLLHFIAYFGLAAMAAAAFKTRRPVILACFGLILLGGVLEIVQGFTGRDMSVYDEIANTLGVFAGGTAARAIVEPLRRRWT
jgi:VanZ family protein